MYVVFPSKRYKKSLKRLSRSTGFDREILDRVIICLAEGKPLERVYLDHPLRGDMTGARECHLRNDLLLVYRIEELKLVLILIDIGPHASVFS